MRYAKILLLGLLVLSLFALIASCGDQPLQPRHQSQTLDVGKSLTDTTLMTETDIPWPPPDSIPPTP